MTCIWRLVSVANLYNCRWELSLEIPGPADEAVFCMDFFACHVVLLVLCSTAEFIAECAVLLCSAL